MSARGALGILDPGPLALVEDLGRPGVAHLGVARSGALDRGALALANRLVGNADGAAGIEVLLGGFRARAVGADLWVAVAGAWGAVAVAGRPVEPYTAVRLHDGEVLELGAASRGLRFMVAVRGGVDAPVLLGSRSRDTLAGIGPEPLAAGDLLPIGGEVAASVPLLDEPAAYPPPDGPVVLALAPGPRRDWLDDPAALFERPWRLAAASDRVGARLEGEPLARRAGEVPSEPTVPGAVQLPPSGLPTVLLADRPVTGGYPVVAVVTPASLDRLAQVRPGQEVRFRHA